MNNHGAAQKKEEQTAPAGGGESPGFALKGFPLTTQEALELYNMINARLAIKRYMKLHSQDRCIVCNKFIINHGRKAFMRCIQQSHG